jgi:FAD/FMN-containing dehydrogenase
LIHKEAKLNLITKRTLLLASGALIGGYLGAKYGPKNPVLDGTSSLQPKGGQGTLNDASNLSETPIHKHIIVKQDPGQGLVDSLRATLKAAKAEGRPVSLSAARHSMGGQSIPRGGHAITLETDFFEPDTDNGTFRCSAGLRWDSALRQMDAIGFGPKVMQSNNDFGIGSTFCVNAHGWPVPYSAMGSTTRSFKILLEDGALITCSRDENQETFDLSMGGYGLTGLITEMEVEMVPNARLIPTFQQMSGPEFGVRFVQALKDTGVQMAYGRLNVDKGEFFDSALMITYRPTDDQSDLPVASTSGLVSKFARHLFRAQLGNEGVKRRRWWVETELQARMTSGAVTRNSLINEPVVTLDDHDPTRTDILHEYFIAPSKFSEWVAMCKRVIPGSYQELLNITLRFVAPDKESVLSYAPEQRIACVMLFSQEMTVRAEADMRRMTEALVGGTAALGGAYYLPYRLHATQNQFTSVYPRAEEFVARKRKLDPNLRFRNGLWDTYMAGL